MSEATVRIRLIVVALLVIASAGILAFTLRDRSGAMSAARASAIPIDAQGGRVVLDSRRRQLGGISLAQVSRRTLSDDVRSPAMVVYDERTLVDVNLRVTGWIRDLHVTHVGQAVGRGDTLFTLYSPELITAQTQFVTSLNSRDQMANDRADYLDRLVDSPRIRLQRWDVPDDQLLQIEKTRTVIDAVTFRAPADGVVIEKMAMAGRHVEPGETLYRLADLSSVWVEAALSEADSAQVGVGNSAVVTADSLSDEEFTGRVVHVFPFVSESTRTVKARIAVPNTSGRLKPGMLATARISSRTVEGVTVPADAIVDSGNRQIVFVSDGNGYFEPRQVSLGMRRDGQVLVREGLREGESVAKSGAFLLDSESQMRAALDSYRGASGVDPVEGEQTGLQITLRSTPEPSRVGENRFEVHLTDAAGVPVADAQVTVVLSMAAMPSMNMPAMRSTVALAAAEKGLYRGAGTITMAGRWDVSVVAARQDQPLASIQTALIAR